MSITRRIHRPIIACVLIAFAMTSAAAASAPQQDLRSPDAHDAAAGRGTVNAPDAITSQVFTDRQRAIVAGFKRSPSYHAGAARGGDRRQTAAARAGPRRRRHRLGRRRHRRREPARTDRARARGHRDDPASQAPGGPDGDCRLTPRTKDRRERGAGTSPAPRRADQATADRSQPAQPARRSSPSSARRNAPSPQPGACTSVTALRTRARRPAAPLTRESEQPEPASITPAADDEEERRGGLLLKGAVSAHRFDRPRAAGLTVAVA